MKKPFVLIAAIVAVAGLGAAVAVAKERAEVKTTVSLKFTADPQWLFSGTVKAKKGCEEGRKVVMVDHAGAHGRLTDKSNARGKYEILYDGLGGPRFHAEAIERKITKDNGDKIVCKTGRSHRVFTPQ